MKNLLYLLTIFFNAIGVFVSLSLFFVAGIKGIDFLPIIVAGCAIFSVSLTVTALDFNNVKKNRKNYKIVYQNKSAIEDYSEYFKSKKYDFII